MKSDSILSLLNGAMAGKWIFMEIFPFRPVNRPENAWGSQIYPP